MMATRADVVMRAQEIARGLTDEERIALGATLICTATRSRNWAAVSAAAQTVKEHGLSLLDGVLRETDNAPSGATAHVNTSGRATGAPDPSGAGYTGRGAALKRAARDARTDSALDAQRIGRHMASLTGVVAVIAFIVAGLMFAGVGQ